MSHIHLLLILKFIFQNFVTFYFSTHFLLFQHFPPRLTSKLIYWLLEFQKPTSITQDKNFQNLISLSLTFSVYIYREKHIY